MPRYAKRTDKTQAPLVAQLREWGYAVYDYSKAGWGIPDLIVCHSGQCEWVEVKTSIRDSLTEAEAAFFDICPGGEPIVAWTADLVHAEFQRRVTEGRRR